jgi:hypothetical protein
MPETTTEKKPVEAAPSKAPEKAPEDPQLNELTEKLKESFKNEDKGGPLAAEEGAASPENATKNENWDKALAALKRETPPGLQKLIDDMDPADVLEQGLELVNKRADKGREGNKLDVAMKRIDALEQQLKAEDSDTEAGEESLTPPSEESPTSTLDLSELLQPLDEDLYPDLRETLTKSLGQLAGHLERDIGAKLDALAGAFQSERVGDVRRLLGERFPSLRDPVVFSEVQKTMREIEPVMEHDREADQFDRTSKTMTRAVMLLGANKGSKGRKRGSGADNQPPIPTRRENSEQKEMTKEEQAHAYLVEGFRTGSVAAARRASGLGMGSN